MSYYIQWSKRRYSELKEHIVVCFEDWEETDLQEKFFYEGPLSENSESYTSRYCYPYKVAEYKSNIGEFWLILDTGGNVIIHFFSTECSYVKLPSEVYDPSGQCYPIKRIDGVFGHDRLKGLYIPEGIERMDGLFARCEGLLDIFFPKSLTFFSNIFGGLPQYELNEGGKIWYPGSKEEWNALVDGGHDQDWMDCTPYNYLVRYYDPDLNIRIPAMEVETQEGIHGHQGTIRVCNMSGDVVIPSSWKEGKREIPISKVGRGAFAGNKGLKGITIPPSIHEIGSMAFYGCKALKKVDILPGADKLVLGEEVFCQCPKLHKVESERYMKIDEDCFACGEGCEIEEVLKRDENCLNELLEAIYKFYANPDLKENMERLLFGQKRDDSETIDYEEILNDAMVACTRGFFNIAYGLEDPGLDELFGGNNTHKSLEKEVGKWTAEGFKTFIIREDILAYKTEFWEDENGTVFKKWYLRKRTRGEESEIALINDYPSKGRILMV